MAEHTCHTRHRLRGYIDWVGGGMTDSPAPTPLTVAAVNGTGEPLALVCPICRAQYTTGGDLIGKPDTYRALTDAGTFTSSARRLIEAGAAEQGELNG